MKVLIIDPWCSDTYEVYTIGLCEGLSKIVDLTMISNYYESRREKKYKIIPLFFRKSDKMKRNPFRKIIRGIEYIISYLKIAQITRKERFDVIHVEWALFNSIDPFLIGRLKKYCNKLVFTSHNVIPHRNGEKKIEELRALHQCFDRILVHGESIKNEYLMYFPEDEEKLRIQYHGIHFTQRTTYDLDNVDKSIIDFVSNCEGKCVVFIGQIFYNKGTDRVMRYWIENEDNSLNRLIVAGKVVEEYKELDDCIKSIVDKDNILYIPRFLNDDEYSYVAFCSDIITIPYRHASMSGIVYSAAAFSKAIIYTSTGAISEYVGDTCYSCENDDTSFYEKMTSVMKLSKEELNNEGNNLHHRIYDNYMWDTITEKLVKEVYS